MTNCKFNLTGKDKCKNIVLPGYQYCADHLNALTEHFVRDCVSGILIDHLMLNRSGFDLNSRIIDDMGADSLDTVELAMAVEEVFGLEIQDDEAEKIVTGFDIFEFVLQKLKDNEEYIVNSLDFRKSIEELKARPGSVQKQIDAISDSELMNDYLKKLGLKCIEFKYLLGEQISSNWIEHITTVPELDKNGKLDQSHVIILTQNYIFYYRLMFRSIFARMEDIREVEIFPKYEYDDVGKMSAIRTYIKMEDVGDSEKLSDETFKFSFYSEHGISEAKAFLNKYFRFRQMAWKRL